MQAQVPDCWRVEIEWKSQGYRILQKDSVVREDFFDRIPLHDLWYISQGRGQMELVNGMVYPIMRGSLVFIRPGLIRQMKHEKNSQPLATNFFHFKLYDIHSDKLVTFEDTKGLPVVGNCQDPTFMETLCMQILHQGLVRTSGKYSKSDFQSAFANQLIKAMLCQLLLPDANSSGDSAISNVLRYRQINGLVKLMEEQPERYNSIAAMAASCKLSQAYFTRLFTKITGKPPITTLIEARIKKSKYLLSSSDLNIDQIAATLGYSNTYFFCRQFKKLTSMTPTQYRRKA